MEKNLTTGSVFKNIVLFSLPYLFSYFLQTLYGMADLFIIGQFEGVASTTAVSIGSQVMHMLTVMIVGLAMGTTVSIGQAIGANDHKQAAKAVVNTVILFMAVSITLMAVLLVLVHPIVSAMSTPAEAVEGTAAYLTICFIGIPFITAYNIISSIFRGMGDSKSPMYFIAVACIANIGLDYLFMGVLRFGSAGAALGTTLSQAISVAVSLVVILKRKNIVLEKADFRPQRPMIGKILKTGVPIAFQDGLIQIAFMVITIIANQRGLNDAAAVGIVEKVIGFLFMIPSSMLSTVSALGAQNIGAGKPERAIHTLCYAIRCSQIKSLQEVRKSSVSAVNISVVTFSTVFLRESISVSAVISVLAENPCFPFCIISWRLHWCVSPVSIWPHSYFRRHCFRWAWLQQRGLYCPLSSVSLLLQFFAGKAGRFH